MNKHSKYILLLFSVLTYLSFSCTELNEQDPRYKSYLESVENEKENQKGIIRRIDKNADKESGSEKPTNQLEPTIINRNNKKAKDLSEEKEPLTKQKPPAKTQTKKKVISNKVDSVKKKNENQIKKKPKQNKKSPKTKKNTDDKIKDYQQRKNNALKEIEKIRKEQKQVVEDSTKKKIQNILDDKNRLKKKLGFD